MAIIAGQAVRGDNFWDRPYIMEDILEIIENGGHILLIAPRRVGKTSLMYRVLDTVDDEYVVIYINTQAQQSVNTFWEKLFTELMDDDFVATLENKAKNLYKKMKSIRFSEIGVKGVKFGDSKEIDYSKAFEVLLKSLDGDKKLIVMIDEFSQTIENIINYESIQKAEQLLEEHRDLRQNHKISDNVVFIYAGSIGLESVVGRINSTRHINDLTDIQVPPLSRESAKEFINHLSETNNMNFSEDIVDYMLEKIEWYIPFYIQLISQEMKRLYRRNPMIDKKTVDQAIENILVSKKDFIHWEERLNSFSKERKAFAKEVLNQISQDEKLSRRKIQNIGAKYKLKEDGLNKTIDALKYDGYINNSDDARIYRFNSPILRTWWYRNVAN